MSISFNANEIFQIGVEIEKNGKAFYQAAAKSAKTAEAKKLFEELSRWESGHIAIFETLKNKLAASAREETAFDPDNEALLYLKAAADTHVFGQNANAEALAAECKTALATLKMALNFEKDSVVVYANMRNLVPEKLGKPDIDKLLNEELQHISQANRKYLAFAKKAETEGFSQVAKLFRAAAEAETVHAHAHLRVAGGIKGTAENLKVAIEGEGFEFQKMYPQFVAEAESEGNKPAEISFKNAMAVEEIHHGLYKGALAAIETGSDLPAAKIYVCAVCGNTVTSEPPDKCPICGVPKARFAEVK
jgi:rubrerythrin